MRRAPIVIGATIASTAGVLTFHPQSPAIKTASASTTSAMSPARISGASPSSASSGTRSGSSSSATTRGAGSRSATGGAISTQYGNVQVRVTVKDGKIADIAALQLTDSDPRSVQISASAEPILKQEALSKQSADVDGVSGASYTSAGYAQSLQSALDKLGFKTATRTTLQVPSGGN